MKDGVKMALSVLILAKNEEKNIADCINSIRFADEIIVVDDFSTDRTAEIAQSLGAIVYQRSLGGDWGAQQNFAIDQAKTKWIFFLDADERVTPKLEAEICQAVRLDKPIAYLVPRQNHLMGSPIRYGAGYPDYVCRLFPRENVRVVGLVHPYIDHPYPEKRLKNCMIHYTYVSWEQYFNKFNHYTKLAAEKYLQNGKRAGFIRDILLRPMFAFIKMFIIRGGWLDGRQGFILAVFHYCYTMAKYVKLYYLQDEKKFF